MASHQPVQDLPDLKERQPALLMASEPQSSTFSERHLAAGSGSVPLPFQTQETLLLDADNVSEGCFPVLEVSPDSPAAGDVGRHSDHEWSSGLGDLDDLDAAHCGRHWSPLWVALSIFSILSHSLML